MNVHTEKGTRLLLGCGAAAVAIAAAGQAGAQAAQQASAPSTVQEVVVTANKRAEKLHDVAMGVTALGGGQLDTQQDTSFLDYVALVPGLSIQSTEPGLARLTLRGENTGGVGSTTAVYIDESPFGSSNGLANGSITTGDYDTWDLQRVEVLRGPQGTLYGASTEGGLLKFVSNAPNPNAFDGAVEFGGESVDHGQTAGDVKAMVNLPLMNGKAALRVSGFEEQLPGYINDPQLHAKDVNSGNKYGVRASFLYKPSDVFSLRLTATNQLLRAGEPPEIDVVGAAFTPSKPPANQFQPTDGLSQNKFIPGRTRDRIDNYSATAVWNPGPVSITSVTSFGALKLSYTVDDTAAVDLPAGALGPGSPPVTIAQLIAGIYGPGTDLGLVQTTDLHKYTQEVRIASKPGDKLEWQVGGFFTREDTLIHQEYLLVPAAPPALTPGGDMLKGAYAEWAGFADATYHFLPQFDVEAGGRWSSNTQKSLTFIENGLLTTGLAGPTVRDVSSSGSDFTYSVAPRWHVNRDTLVYARVATGYRPGGPNDVPVGVTGAPISYASDTTFNYEVGLRSSLLDRKLSIDVAAFHIDWNNIQLFESLTAVVGGRPVHFGVNANGGDARSQGVEWTIGLFPISGLTLNWTGAYTDAVMSSIKNLPGASGIAAKPGDQLPWVPQWQTALDGQYEWPLVSDYKAFVGGTFAFTGSRYTDFIGSTNDTDVNHTKLPSYDTIALRTGVENGKWRIEFYGKNLGDERGITGYSSEGAPNLQGTISIIQPRTFGLVISAKY